MSVSSGKKEFDVKQILRLRWRWFSHPTQGSPGSGGCLQQEGYEHRGTPVHSRLKSHSRDRNGLKKNSSPVHNILAPVPGPTPVHHRSIQSWHQQNIIEHFPASEDFPKSNVEEKSGKEEESTSTQEVKAIPEEHQEAATDRIPVTSSSPNRMNPAGSDEYFQSLNHAEQTFRKMENYLQQKQLCDVLLIAGNHKIPAHRLVLSAVSDYFAAMFTNDVREAKEEEIKMEGVDPDALKALVHYAYTGILELKEDTIESLLSAACLLQLSPVIEVCCNFLMKQLHPSNCLGIRSFGDAQGCMDLLRVAHSYTMLLADLENSPLFANDLECQKFLMEAMKYHLLPERRSMMQSPRTKPRKSTVGALYAVGGMDATKGATTIEKYDLRTNSWIQISTMNGRRLQFGVAVIDNKLYVVGGRDGLKTSNTVECFNPISKVWSIMPPMSTHRHGLGVAVLEGPMYAVGGHDGWSYLNTVERWDPQARQWNYVASMSTPRSTVGVAALNSKLYAVGGRDGSSCLKSMECFDPHTNKWSMCAPMSKRRGGVGVATYNSFLYAVGGHDAPASNHCSRLSDCVERYDPKTDSWTTVAPLSVPRDAVGVCALGDKLYAVGGYDGQTYLNTVESYDAQTNEWTQDISLNIGRAGTSVVVIKLP
uniref:Kelch like family member 4 n=1 Tax=Leptobrachium leishanense TaxID=445787 RepID=A0A8C5PLI8_9ANUR